MAKLSFNALFSFRTHLFVFLVGVLFLFSASGARSQEEGEECLFDGVSGVVFRDYNANGSRDALEPGVEGVTISATDSSGAVVDSELTDAVGFYQLSIPSGLQVRVELSGLPAYLKAGFFGPQSKSNVLFITAEGSCDVDFAVQNSSQYCDANPNLVTTCYAGTGAPALSPSVLEFIYESGTTSTVSNNGVTEPGHPVLALLTQVGPIRGLGYHRKSDTVIGGAYTKRHVTFPSGPDNNAPDKIFRLKRDGSAPTVFFTADAGNDNHDYLSPDVDLAIWGDVGKTGWADIQVGEDETSAYAVNLFDKLIYRIPLSIVGDTLTAGSATTISLASIGASCSDGEYAPGAVRAFDGKIYLSVTCTAETSGLLSDLKGIIVAFDPLTSALSVVANINFNYSRGNVSRSGFEQISANWNPWVNTVTVLPQHPYGQDAYPQPWITDIEFDEAGNMIVGVSDRAGDQFGNDNSFTGTTEGVSAGDTLRLTKSGATWQLNAGGDDFYNSEKYPLVLSPIHDETSLGSLALVFGRGEVISNAYNPAPVEGAIFDSTGTVQLYTQSVRSGGVIYMSSLDGSRTRSHQLFGLDEPATFGKVAGIGDIEPVCEESPAEIGNRVWHDTNGDCTQNANEPPMAGVTVSLVRVSDGVVVATAVTDSAGTYYFNSKPDDQNSTNNLAGGLKFGVEYEVRVGLAQQALAGLSLTNANCGTSDSVDSDATELNGDGVVAIPARNAGENDHTFDIGFTEVKISSNVRIGDYVWFDTNKNGIQDAGEPPFAGVTVRLIDKTTGVVVDSTVTNANGFYFFDQTDGLLPNTNYKVVLNNAADFTTGGALTGLDLTTADQGSDGLDSDAMLMDGFPAIMFISPPAGGENLTLDFGFVFSKPGESFEPEQAAIDSNAFELRSRAIAAVRLRLKGAASGDCSRLSNSQADALIAQIENEFTDGVWTTIWSQLSSSVFNFASSAVPASCSVVSFSSPLAEIQQSVDEMAKIGKNVLRRCRSSWSRSKNLSRRIDNAANKTSNSVSQYPTSAYECK